ncbi:hypothetical protein LCGC14_2211190, partial [marine sediment metagenome]
KQSETDLKQSETDLKQSETDLKQSEDDLRISEEKFRVLAESTSDCITRYDNETRHIYGNPAALEATGVTLEQYVGKTHRDLGFPEHLCRLWEDNIKSVFSTGKGRSVEFEVEQETGIAHLDMKLDPESAPDGTVQSVVGISRDITEHKKAEEKIEKALDEKKVLLAEVHHRTKNNMAIMTALMDMQLRRVENPEARECLEENLLRIKSLALVHDNLYQSKDFSKPDVKEYIESLASNISSSSFAKGSDINIRTDVDDIALDLKQLLPIGLLINELATNSIKHAFKQKGSGDIIITLVSDGPNNMLRVSDNGTGLPEGFDYDTTKTLGLKLIDILTKQIKGSLDMRNSNGLTVTIKFERTA